MWEFQHMGQEKYIKNQDRKLKPHKYALIIKSMLLNKGKNNMHYNQLLGQDLQELQHLILHILLMGHILFN